METNVKVNVAARMVEHVTRPLEIVSVPLVGQAKFVEIDVHLDSGAKTAPNSATAITALLAITLLENASVSLDLLETE